MGKPKTGLTSKQRHFALALGSGNGMTLSDAYREAYDCENMSGAAIRNEASKLAANPDIAMMISRQRERNERSIAASMVNDRESSEIAVEIERRLAALQDRAESEEDQPTPNGLH